VLLRGGEIAIEPGCDEERPADEREPYRENEITSDAFQTSPFRRAGLSGPPAPVRSCVTPVSTMAGAEITTLEGLGTIEKPHPIQKAFIDEQAIQCGFCLSGVILTAKVALDRNPRATDAQLRQSLASVLCRCGAHTRMMKAIKRYQGSAQGRTA
jgi:[2Fe-2S] binding domain